MTTHGTQALSSRVAPGTSGRGGPSASPALSLIEQMQATAAAENKAARAAWPDWCEPEVPRNGGHGKARAMKLAPNEVAQKLADGWSKAAIARHYGVGWSTVDYCIRKMERGA